MDQSALLLQLMQSLNTHPQEDPILTEPPPFEHTLLSLKPLMPPRQQRIIDLMIKMQELKALLYEIQEHH